MYVSTGTLVGHSNGFDYRRALGVIADLCAEDRADGLELMMLRFYYDKIPAVCDAVQASGVHPAMIHCEKDVGTLLSDAAARNAEGKIDEARALYTEAERLFRLNCDAAERLSIARMVLHLWGGFSSDGHIEENIAVYPHFASIAREHGVRILCENIPSNHTDPKTNWLKLLPYLGDGGLIFDTRFGKLHEQIDDILTDPALTAKIEHIHISDFAGTYRDFAALRPILHPGEGSIDFAHVAHLLNAADYRGTITLESPVMVGEDLDTAKLRRTLDYLRADFPEIYLFHITRREHNENLHGQELPLA